MLDRGEGAVNEDEDVIRKGEARRRDMKWLGNCILSKQKKRNSHESVSKAFAMSTLMETILHKSCLTRKYNILKHGLESCNQQSGNHLVHSVETSNGAEV